MPSWVRELTHDPLFGFAVGGLVLLIVGWKVTAPWANGLLVLAWACLIIAFWRVPSLRQQSPMAHLLWTATFASALGLVIFYTLWTDVSRLNLSFGAEASSVSYVPGAKVGTITWQEPFIQLRIAIQNDTRFSFTELNLVVIPDEPIAAITQVGGPSVTLEATESEIIRLIPTRKGEALPEVPSALVATSVGYQIRCEKMPPKSTIRLILALARVNEKRPPGTSVLHHDMVVAVHGTDNETLEKGTTWFAPVGFSPAVYAAGANPRNVAIRGSFVVREHEKTAYVTIPALRLESVASLLRPSIPDSGAPPSQ